MHQVISHIPFDNATSLINNAIVLDMHDNEEYKHDNDNNINGTEEYKYDDDNNMSGTMESKYDNDNDMDISVELTNNDIQPRERTLDAIYIYDDDLDETKSIIWAQYRMQLHVGS